MWKTDDPALNKTLRQSFTGRIEPRRIPVNLTVRGAVGEPLEVVCELPTGAVTVRSSLVLQAARTAPLTDEKLREHLGRFGEHPYSLGRTEIVPMTRSSFTQDEAISVVFQMCNYGAPDADLTADYTFYRTDGTRRIFNRTDAQQFADADLPPPAAWSTQAFAMQTVALQTFPPGEYELEVAVRDRLTRATAKATVAFTVASGLR